MALRLGFGGVVWSLFMGTAYAVDVPCEINVDPDPATYPLSALSYVLESTATSSCQRLSNVTSLRVVNRLYNDMSPKDLNVFQKSLLTNYTGLRSLFFHTPPIYNDWPLEVFATTTRLTELHLTNCVFQQDPAVGAFKFLTQLQKLAIGAQAGAMKLSSLPDLNALTKLTYLQLNYSSFANLSSLTGLTALQHLEINNLNGTSFDFNGGWNAYFGNATSAFAAMKSLETVRFDMVSSLWDQQSKNSTLPQGLFQSNTALKEVVIKGTKLVSIPAALFSKAPLLERVDFSSSGVSNPAKFPLILPRDSFNNNRKMDYFSGDGSCSNSPDLTDYCVRIHNTSYYFRALSPPPAVNFSLVGFYTGKSPSRSSSNFVQRAGIAVSWSSDGRYLSFASDPQSPDYNSSGWIFTRNNSSWNQTFVVEPSKQARIVSLSADGSMVAVCARTTTTPSSHSMSFYSRSGGSVTFLVTHNISNPCSQVSLSTNGDVVAVAVPASHQVLIFLSRFSYQVPFPDATYVSVSGNGQILAVGSPKNTSVYYCGSSQTCSNETRLVMDSSGPVSLSASGDTLAVGVPKGKGHTSVYTRKATGSWVVTSNLVGTDGDEMSWGLMGNLVRSSGQGQYVSLTSNGLNLAMGNGQTVWIFSRSSQTSTNWSQVFRTSAFTYGGSDVYSVALSPGDGTYLAVGDGTTSNYAGGVWVFKRQAQAPPTANSSSAPTASPSTQPPTVSPSAAPSAQPPTVSPSSPPTLAPSNSPTSSVCALDDGLCGLGKPCCNLTGTQDCMQLDEISICRSQGPLTVSIFSNLVKQSTDFLASTGGPDIKLFAKVSGQSVSVVSFNWTLPSGVVPKSSAQAQTLVVAPATFPAGKYVFRVRISERNRVVNGNATVRLIDNPKPGKCMVMPGEGPFLPFNTSFFVNCSGWQVFGSTAVYELVFKDANSKRNLVVSSVSVPPSDSTVLIPVGTLSKGNWSFMVRATDSFGGRSSDTPVQPETLAVADTAPKNASEVLCQRDPCCRVQKAAMQLRGSSLAFSPKVWALVGLLEEEKSSLPRCGDPANDLVWFQPFAVLLTEFSRAGDLSVQTCSSIAQAIYLLVSRAPPSQIVSNLELLLNATSSCLTCEWSLTSLDLLLGLLADTPEQRCSQIQQATRLFSTISCGCASNQFPGETQNVTSSTTKSSVSKCLADPAFPCEGLPAGLNLNPDVLAQIAADVKQDKVIGRQTSIAIITHKALQRCRNASNAIASNITSITIFSNCSEVKVANVKNISFVLQIQPQPQQQNQESSACRSNKGGDAGANENNAYLCKFWRPETLTWSSDGCSATTINSTAVMCVCSHLTDFALFYRLKQCSEQTLGVGGTVLGAAFLVVCAVCLVKVVQGVKALRVAGPGKLKESARHTVLVCVKQMGRIAVACLSRAALLFLNTADTNTNVSLTLVAVLSLFVQLSLFYTFGSVMLTWAHVQHFGAKGIQQDLLRKQIFAISGLILVTWVTGFVLIAVSGQEDGATIAKTFGAATTVFSIALSACFLLFGVRVGNIQNQMQAPATPSPRGSSTIKKRSANNRNARHTWFLSVLLSGLFVTHSVFWAVSSFSFESDHFHTYLLISEATVLVLVAVQIRAYYPRLTASLRSVRRSTIDRDSAIRATAIEMPSEQKSDKWPRPSGSGTIGMSNSGNSSKHRHRSSRSKTPRNDESRTDVAPG